MKRALLFLLFSLLDGRALAQEFAGPAPPLGDRSPMGFLEHGLPPSAAGAGVAALAVRWHGLPELVTRSIGAGMGWRSARVAAGISQTGAQELGWGAIGIGLGVTTKSVGMGLRACGRATFHSPAIEPNRGGVEIGAGAWTAVSERFQLWASAPQAFTHGVPPPLERWLEIGAVARIGDSRLWLARALAPGSPRGTSSEHAGGMEVPLGIGALWAELRDHPLRGRVGIEARAGLVAVAAQVESHPVLDETVRLRLLVGRSGP